jgi:hypothetical protein
MRKLTEEFRTIRRWFTFPGMEEGRFNSVGEYEI